MTDKLTPGHQEDAKKIIEFVGSVKPIEVMTDKDKKLAEEILEKYGFIHPYNKNLNPGQQTYLDSIEKAMQEHAEAWHSAKMAGVTDEGRKCLGCGTPLGDYCEQCQHLLES